MQVLRHEARSEAAGRVGAVIRPLRSPPRSILREGPALATTFVLSTLVAGLMVVESALGLLVHDLYPEARWAVAAFRGNDLVTLVVAAPILAASVWWSRRAASPVPPLVWLGLLGYGVYNFAYYTFGAAFNDVFLLHVATLALSLVALVLLAGSLDVGALADRISSGTTPRVVAAFLTVVGAAFIVAWGGFSIRWSLTGKLPKDVMPPTAIHLVYALDMALLAPSFLAAGLLLWRRAAWGYALGLAVSVFGAVYLTVLEVVGGFQANAGIAGKTWASTPAIAGAALLLWAAVTLAVRGRGRRSDHR